MQRTQFISIYCIRAHKTSHSSRTGCFLRGNDMLSAMVDFSFIVANFAAVLGLSGLLLLNSVFPTAEGCPAWAKPLFQIMAALGAVVVVAVLIQHADQIAPRAWAFAASDQPQP